MEDIPTSVAPSDYISPEALLAEYQRRKVIESMAGPLVSLIVHILVIASIIIFYEADTSTTKVAI